MYMQPPSFTFKQDYSTDWLQRKEKRGKKKNYEKLLDFV